MTERKEKNKTHTYRQKERDKGTERTIVLADDGASVFVCSSLDKAPFFRTKAVAR